MQIFNKEQFRHSKVVVQHIFIFTAMTTTPDLIIRQEEAADYEAVFNVIESAFKQMEHSDHQEQWLVQRLRQSPGFIPALSLVAVSGQQIIGHILLTPIKIKNEKEEFASLALAPVSVIPEYQHKGIGGRLIEAAHQKAREAGFRSVVLLGHAAYYPRFGYKKASEFGIRLPFDVPDEYCMAIELTKDGLNGVNGMVEYPAAFFA